MVFAGTGASIGDRNYYGQTGSTYNNDVIWRGWITNSDCYTSTTTSTDQIWNNWCSTATIACTGTTTNTIWIRWCDQTEQNLIGGYQNYNNPLGNQLQAAAAMQARSADYQAQLQAAQERRQAEEAERNTAQQAASKRAMELLRENLTEKQRKALDKHGWFLVEGGRSKKTYRVYGDRGYAGNIFELDDKRKEIARYCVHASYEIPLGDQLLAQAIYLTLDEEHLIKTANRTPMREAA